MKKRLMIAGLLLAATPLANAAAQNNNAEYATTEKGFRVGDPEAPLKLVEFISYTCPHCADFAAQSDAVMRALYIHEGRASVEVRHFIRNNVDLAAALVTECGADDKFFDNHRTMLAAHPQWMEKAMASSAAERARWTEGTMSERMRAIASDFDFYELMEPRGYSVAELDQCLGDAARAQQIADASRANAAEFNVPGTPSFVLNGALLEGVHSWPALEQVLAQPAQ